MVVQQSIDLEGLNLNARHFSDFLFFILPQSLEDYLFLVFLKIFFLFLTLDYLLDQLEIQAHFPVKGGLLLAQKLLENLKA